MAALRAMWADVQAGRLPDEPTIEWYMHTTVDPSLQDGAGHHPRRCSCSRCPTTWTGRPGTEALPVRRAAAGHLRAVRAGHADLVADALPLTPPGIEGHFGITGGHIHHVDNTVSFTDRMPYATGLSTACTRAAPPPLSPPPLFGVSPFFFFGPCFPLFPLVRHRPLARSNRQPCSWQVSVLPSMMPNRVRSAFRCGQRRCTTQSPRVMSSASRALVLVVPALGVLQPLLGQALEERVDELVVLADPGGREAAGQEQRVDPVDLVDVQQVLDQRPLGAEAVADLLVGVRPHLLAREVDHDRLDDLAVVADQVEPDRPADALGQVDRLVQQRLDAPLHLRRARRSRGAARTPWPPRSPAACAPGTPAGALLVREELVHVRHGVRHRSRRW